MDSADEIMQVCRLCLVKEEVNTPIFDEEGDDDRIFLKISTCLPVKVSKEDNLPKNICDGCSSKLEELYEFWNKSASSEKKLVKWLCQLELDKSDKMQHSMNTSDPVILKQEVVDVAEGDSTGDDLIPEVLNVSNDAPDYMLQEQLPYQPVEIQFQQDGFETTSENSLAEKETKGKLCKRRAAAMKALASFQSEDEDDADLVKPKIAKTEDPSDESGEEPEPTAFVSLPSGDNEQPGPSGVGKSSNDAPLHVDESTILKRLIIGPSMTVTVSNPSSNLIDTNTTKKVTTVLHKPMKIKVEKEEKQEKRKQLRKKIKINEKVQCDVCDTTFKNNIAFALHSIKHNKNKRYSCHMCSYTSTSKYHFEMHVRAHEGSTGYKCEICDKAFTVSTHAVEHKYFHTGEKPFQCEICGKHFMFSWFLTSHRRTQHWEIITGMPLVKYDCTICNKHYTSSTGLKRHKLSQHNKDGTETFVLCDICGKRLSSKEKLKFHRRIHTGYKPYSCITCSKSFTRKEQLKEHERVHTGEKPYICKYCGKGFTQRSPLRIHERTHTGERPYVCCLCERGFISKGVMDTHMKNCSGVSIKK